MRLPYHQNSNLVEQRFDVVPNIRDCDGHHISPTEYKSTMKDGSTVIVNVHLKLLVLKLLSFISFTSIPFFLGKLPMMNLVIIKRFLIQCRLFQSPTFLISLFDLIKRSSCSEPSNSSDIHHFFSFSVPTVPVCEIIIIIIPLSPPLADA